MIVLYSTGCPKCTVLKKKLDEKGIPYGLNTSVKDMLSKGFLQIPVLDVDGVIMDFTAANEWINNLEEEM